MISLEEANHLTVKFSNDCIKHQNIIYNYYSVKGIILQYTTKPERSLFISQSFDYFFISLTYMLGEKKKMK